ncbi:hypothetical protein QQ008_21300 [Fulvivirgaceae bacterium BMA10]|uniref:Uncharacterized protein n=1 Tax=Splendidivirga corallicola TaxID=3051826 RepID=A0ABT8KWG0_9BACT|nr:hypothetical protein [Fulvivirgaceae bacterium BMA10]
MRLIKYYTFEVGTEGNGYLRLELDDGTVIPSVPFPQQSNFAGVCSMLQHSRAFYENVNGQHKFISTNQKT